MWAVLAVCGLYAGSAFNAGSALAQPPGGEAGCRPPVVGRAAVKAALDGRTVLLADGRALRLAGLEAPTGGEPHAAAAHAALGALVAGREVVLQRFGPGTDRHGRVTAQVMLAPTDGGAPRSAQRELLRLGHARVAARVAEAGCATPYLAAERAARASGLGLWSHPYYKIRKADRPAEVLAERGRFALVEGLVLSVRESGATVYVNFGRRWSEDFTVTVLRRNARGFAAAGMELGNLAGRRVRVRGTVEERGGPWIEAAWPEQIAIAERD